MVGMRPSVSLGTPLAPLPMSGGLCPSALPLAFVFFSFFVKAILSHGETTINSYFEMLM